LTHFLLLSGVGGSKTAAKKKTYDLNTQIDQFLASYASVSFPLVVDANTKELEEVTHTQLIQSVV
jgi:hypothetical protein